MMVSGGLEKAIKRLAFQSQTVVLTMKTSVFEGGWFYLVNIAIVIFVKDVSINDTNDFTQRFTFLYRFSHF